MKDFYAILGVQPNATAQQIREKYLFLSKSFHPDVNSNPAATKAMQDVTEAYAVLKDASKRRAYDLQRKVKEFTPKVEPSGVVNLVGLMKQFAAAGRVPVEVVNALTPVVERKLGDVGITATAATAEQVLEAIGWLKPKRKVKRRA